MYLIWSNEHKAWWAPDRAGYTNRIARAGRYTHQEALDICYDAMPGNSKLLEMLPEIPVLESDVMTMLERFASRFPGVDAKV
jgi:hypothetical protein